MALRNYFNELYLEKTGTNLTIGSNDNDDSSCDSDVSLSSDEESFVGNNEGIDEDENDVSNVSTNGISINNDLNASTNHTRRCRYRRSQGVQSQRPLFAVTSDNARGLRGEEYSIGGGLTARTYHSKLSSTSCIGTGLQTSASNHSYSSLGSRTGISNTSVNKWRMTQKKAKTAMISRSEHLDSRWSTHGNDIPKGSLSNRNSSNRVKSYDFGFVNDSLHSPSSLRKKNTINNNKMVAGRRSRSKNNTEQQTSAKSLSCRKVIDSAVRLAEDSDSSDSSSEGDEFYEDDDVSISSFTMSTFDDSKTSKTSTVGSSLNFGNNYRVKSKAMDLPPCRVAPARTRSVGDMPRLPRRTLDDSFDLNNESASETFEALKGGSVSSFGSISSPGGFQKNKIWRSKSNDSLVTMSLTSKESEEHKQRGSDSFGRWGATTGARSKNIDTSLKCPQPPRRVPSASMSNRSTGQNTNHSNSSSEVSESDTDFNASSDFNNSFAGCPALDDSVCTTVNTTGSSNKDHSSFSSKDQDEALTILLPIYSSHHSSRILNRLPGSLRTLPNHSYHGSSTISSKSIARSKHTGKSLHSFSRKW
eukprot:CAMPEP_0197183658 /NCGR_PEP_ID=MMETSP1423-20130617/7938_1 /TAXON_ID=476441 /ORGANISM="Pseudo-nitzschia heimii, Strain UNC1101" /LENGTH=586 /DNA_ID=CAMNT_0042634259 /DNA_START=115 /DNA_END=1872 /DNA_ORIENTATION=-